MKPLKQNKQSNDSSLKPFTAPLMVFIMAKTKNCKMCDSSFTPVETLLWCNDCENDRVTRLRNGKERILSAQEALANDVSFDKIGPILK